MDDILGGTCPNSRDSRRLYIADSFLLSSRQLANSKREKLGIALCARVDRLDQKAKKSHKDK